MMKFNNKIKSFKVKFKKTDDKFYKIFYCNRFFYNKKDLKNFVIKILEKNFISYDLYFWKSKKNLTTYQSNILDFLEIETQF